MSATATVRYTGEGWVLSLGGQDWAYGDQEEAVEEARRRVRDEGGGQIEIGAGPGSDPDRIIVSGGPSPRASGEAEVPAPNPPPVNRTLAPSPPRVVPPTSSSTSPLGALAPASVPPTNDSRDVLGDITRLRTSYQAARGTIEGFEDRIERDIGLGTLRLEADHTLNSLRSTGPGLTEADLAPLTTYVAALKGGETTEAAVERIDQTSEKVLREVSNSLAGMALTGWLAAAAGVVAAIAGAAVEAGNAVMSMVLLGGSALAFFARVFGYLGSVAEGAWNRSWAWADSLGHLTDRALAEPRQLQARLWQSCSRAPWRYEPLAQKARRRAKFTIFLVWLVVAAAVCLFAWGALQAIGEVLNEQIPNQPITTPSPLEP